MNNFKTVAYKGSKRKLVSKIVDLAKEVNARRVFDGFSGTGIVSAALRANGFSVTANDLNPSSYVFGKVFLEGYNPNIVAEHIEAMNHIKPRKGWLTENYSGTIMRKVRGTPGIFERPLGLTPSNASRIDSARDYIEELSGLSERDRNALIFSTIKGCDSVFNNSNDQKSALKEWSKKSLKPVTFESPALIGGLTGTQLKGNIFEIEAPNCDFVYFDPPYTHGVLYASCYHLNDSVAVWDKPELDYAYAIPRPLRASFREQAAGPFYSKKTIRDDFHRLLQKHKGARTVLSYSDAPRNCISIDQLVEVCENHGTVKVTDIEHQICTQYKSQVKRSDSLKEFFIIIDN